LVLVVLQLIKGFSPCLFSYPLLRLKIPLVLRLGLFLT